MRKRGIITPKKEISKIDFENLIKEIFESNSKNRSKMVMIAGVSAKDQYINHLKSHGIPMLLINQTITDNKNGTFTIEV